MERAAIFVALFPDNFDFKRCQLWQGHKNSAIQIEQNRTVQATSRLRQVDHLAFVASAAMFADFNRYIHMVTVEAAGLHPGFGGV